MKNTGHGRPSLVRLSAGSEPPGEFRLFPIGFVETEKGTFHLDPDDMQACLDAQAAYGNELSIDYGHGAFEEADGKPQRAAGWIGGIEARDDGLWAVRVTWTEAAAEMLRKREQRYFSPAFIADGEGHIRKILNVALTLIPATHNLTPLVASRRSGKPHFRRKLSMGKFARASDVEALADEIEAMGDTLDGASSIAGRLRALAESGVDFEEPEKTSEDGEEETTSEDAEDAEKTSEDGEEETTSEDAEDAEKTSEEPTKTSRRGKDDSSRILALARELTGKKHPSEVAGTLRALAGHKQNSVTLSARVRKLEDDIRRRDIEALVQRHSRPGTKDCKLTPSQRAWAIKLGMTDVAQLKAYLKDAPTLAGPASAPADEESNAVTQGVNTLSAYEKKICAQMGNDPAKYLEFKKAQQARRLGDRNGTLFCSPHAAARPGAYPQARRPCRGLGEALLWRAHCRQRWLRKARYDGHKPHRARRRQR